MSLPFSGLKVLDFSQALAGPYASQLLANSGAEIIKVEPPHGDQMRHILLAPTQLKGEDSASFIASNRGKRSIAIDLSCNEGKKTLQRMIEKVDIILENFRPGVMKRFGLDYESVQKVNPTIVYCSVSGYGQEGPMAHQPAYDSGVQAVSGMMSNNGFPETGPTRTGYAPVDISTAIMAAFAVSSAVLRREKTGKGQHVDVSLLDTAIALQLPAFANYLWDGSITGLTGNTSPTGGLTADCFKTADAHVLTAAVTEVQTKKVLLALELDPAIYDASVDRNRDAAKVEALKNEVRVAFRRRSTEEILKVLADVGIVASKIQNVKDTATMDQLNHRNILELNEGWNNDCVKASLGATFISQHDGPKCVGKAPLLGEHSRDILNEFHFTESEIDKLITTGVVCPNTG